MIPVGITRFGAYVPQLRLQRSAIAEATRWYNPALANLAKGERAMASWDEDSITMAVEAARDCLAGYDRARVARIILASTSFPFADRQNAGVVKEALALADTIGSMDVAGSQRAGASALLAALDGAHAGSGPILCLAAERRIAPPASAEELGNGDGAVALLVGGDEIIAEYIGSYGVTADFIDHYRAAERTHDYGWENRWIRDEGYLGLLTRAIQNGLAHHGLAPDAVDHLVLGLPIPGIEIQVGRAIGISPDKIADNLHARLGYGGTAHPLLMLANLLETAGPGKCIALAAFGQGVDLMLFRTTDRAGATVSGLGVSGWLARRQPETNYLKHLHFSREIRLDAGMRSELDLKASHSALYRDRKAVLGLVGGKCRVTGTVQFPRTSVSVAMNGRMVDTQDDYPLADRPARVVTVTADHLAFSPEPPSRYGMIEFEGGGRFIADMVDVGETPLETGSSVRMMFRIKRVDTRNFTQYFWKAAPDYRGTAEKD